MIVFPIIIFLGVIIAGCLENSSEQGTPTDSSLQNAQEMPPDKAGSWNGTTWTVEVKNIHHTFVHYVRLTSLADQRCISEYSTEGNISQPWTIGGGIAMMENRTTFSRGFTHAETVSGQVAGTTLPDDDGEFPRHASGDYRGQRGSDPGEVLEYYFFTSYPPESPNGQGGRMNLEIDCPDGMTELETGWSTSAHLFSDISMNGTWAYVDLYHDTLGKIAQWSAQGDAQWSTTLPQEQFTFVGREPSGGQVALTSPEGEYSCGPSTNPGAIQGGALCRHEFSGGETMLQVNQSSGSVGQSGTTDHWFAFIVQMEHYKWPEPS